MKQTFLLVLALAQIFEANDAGLYCVLRSADDSTAIRYSNRYKLRCIAYS